MKWDTVGILLAFFLGAFGGLFLSQEMDINFEYVERQYTKGQELCHALDSTPVAIDSNTLYCENGAEINWRDL